MRACSARLPGSLPSSGDEPPPAGRAAAACHLDLERLPALLDRFPVDEFYVDAQTAQQAVQSSGQFNIIHPGSGLKIDIYINPDTDAAKRLPTRYADYPLQAGDVFRLDTPGGGGYGDPLARDPERVLCDVREGIVSVEAAERDYGVVLTRSGRTWTIDQVATQARRAQMQNKV